MANIVPPDYKKLQAILLNSGLQRRDYALWQVISKLIDAVQQSQDFIVDQAIPDVADGISGVSGTVVVDAAGALDGDGSAGNPLAARVDGTTITINGSNQLAGDQYGYIFHARGSLTAAQSKTLSTVPVAVISGIANTIIVPINFIGHHTQTGASSNNRVAGVRFSTAGGIIMTAAVPCSSTSAGSVDRLQDIVQTSIAFNMLGASTPVGSDVNIYANGNWTGTPSVYTFDYDIAYIKLNAV
jgi:hypothetical protein